MAIDFPSSPTVGQRYTYNGVTYTYTSQGMWASGVASTWFGAGTAMLFAQAAAPTGWTKVTSSDDKALRIVSGSGGGVGGTVAFSTVFARTADDALTLAVTQIPGHQHFGPDGTIMTGAPSYYVNPGGYGIGYGGVSYTGGGLSHQHGIDLRVQYVDTIICVMS